LSVWFSVLTSNTRSHNRLGQCSFMEPHFQAHFSVLYIENFYFCILTAKKMWFAVTLSS
jgi:hypothetical protein